MKILLILVMPALLVSCSRDDKSKMDRKTETQILEERRDSTKSVIDSLERELRKLEKKKDSLNAIDTDTLSDNQ
jgi:hypothetical protein